MLFNQIRVKSIVAGRHRRMGCENHLSRNAAHRFVEADTFILHPVSDCFEHRKGAVPFIQMKHTGSDSHGSQGTETSDSEQEFLANSNASIAAIEAGGQVSILGRITCDVRIEKNDVTPADLQSPDSRADGTGSCLDLHQNVRSNRQFQRQFGDVGLEVFLLLPAVAIQALAKITLVVEQADTD